MRITKMFIKIIMMQKCNNSEIVLLSDLFCTSLKDSPGIGDITLEFKFLITLWVEKNLFYFFLLKIG